MPGFFVSYRREDSAGFAGRLSDALERRFGADSVFRDVDDIAPGADFEAVIDHGLKQVRAVLVVIGPGWLDASVDGKRRLERADDFVRREIEHALASGKPVIPVLVGGAAMPPAEALPPSLRALTAKQASALRDASWTADLASLEAALAGTVVPAPRRSRRRLWLSAIVLAVVAAGLLAHALRPDGQAGLRALAGHWQGEVAYPWGVTRQERFEFVLHEGRLEGSASFLGVARTIEDAEWRDGALRFVTRSQTVLGSGPPSELVHRYMGKPAAAEIRFRLESRGGYAAEPAVEFTVRRR